MESTAESSPLDSAKGSEVQSRVASGKEKAESGKGNDGFFGISPVTLCLSGLIVVLLLCGLVGIFALGLNEDKRVQPNLDSGDDKDPTGPSNGDPDITDRSTATTVPASTSTRPTHNPSTKPISSRQTSPMSAESDAPTSTESDSTMSPESDSAMSTESDSPSNESDSTKTATNPTTKAPDPCTSSDCHNQSYDLMNRLRFAANPCNDFYDFVCGNFELQDAYTKVQTDMALETNKARFDKSVPETGQSAWQKAVGLVKACIKLIYMKADELDAVKTFLVALKLDPLDIDASQTVDPVDMVVRLSLDLGVPTIFDFRLSDAEFTGGKRAMEFRVSDIREEWQEKRRLMKREDALKYFTYLLSRRSDYNSSEHGSLPEELHDYDEAPKWADSVATYTNGTYKGTDQIRFQRELLDALAELLENSTWAEDGMRAVLSWSLYEILYMYASPNDLFGKWTQTKGPCFIAVLEVMELPIAAHYFGKRVNETALINAKHIFRQIRAAFKAGIQASSWLRDSEREAALLKLHKMKVLVGSPSKRLDDDYVNRYYAGYPDVLNDTSFIEAWVKARSTRVRRKWSDQTNVLFKISRLTPYYLQEANVVVLPVAALVPGLFYAEGNAALNYGTLGDALAQQIMNAYDARRVMCSNNSQFMNGSLTDTFQRYVNTTECLRNVPAEEGHAPLTTDCESIASEKVFDLVGARVAYAAYRGLPSAEGDITLPGVNLTAEQLYFAGRCMNWCSFPSEALQGHSANPRARCNEPAMHLEAFSRAFGCSPKARMNPDPKCSFW